MKKVKVIFICLLFAVVCLSSAAAIAAPIPPKDPEPIEDPVLDPVIITKPVDGNDNPCDYLKKHGNNGKAKQHKEQHNNGKAKGHQKDFKGNGNAFGRRK